MNNKIALITDLHWGVKNDNEIWLEEQINYYTTFIESISEEGIETVIMLGDIFDRRKYSNHNTVDNMQSTLFDPMFEAGIKVYIIVGNHDCFFRNTNRLNAPELFLAEYPNVEVIWEPEEVTVNNLPMLFLPWINEENAEKSYDLIKNTKCTVAMGHLEVSGFEMYRGMGVCQGGLSQKLFKNFEDVFSGHFHEPSQHGNIRYLGAPMQFTWSDYDCDRGFHYYDTETLELTHVINPTPMFVKLYYDDGCDFDAFDELENKTVRLIVSNKDDEEKYKEYHDKIDDIKTFDFSVIDNTSYSFDGADVSNEALQDEDTLKLTESYIEAMPEETALDQDKLKGMFNEIHTEAINAS